MAYRKAILSTLGYEVTYTERTKYRGSATTKQCIAVKDGLTYFAFQICDPDRPEHYQRIQTIQSSIPHMALMVGPIGDVVLLEKAHGKLLWEMELAPDPAVVERQLLEFARASKRHGLIHGDLRPWNVFFDNACGVQVIDWWYLSSFIEDLIGDTPRRSDLINEGRHYARFHPGLVARRDFTEIDLADAKTIGQLLNGEIELTDSEAWQGEYGSLGKFLWDQNC